MTTTKTPVKSSKNTLVGKVILNKTKAVKKPVKKVLKKTVKLPPFVLIDDSDIFKVRIQINDNRFKEIMIHRDSELVSMVHLVSDNEANKELKLVRSRFTVFDLINDGHATGWFKMG